MLSLHVWAETRLNSLAGGAAIHCGCVFRELPRNCAGSTPVTVPHARPHAHVAVPPARPFMRMVEAVPATKRVKKRARPDAYIPDPVSPTQCPEPDNGWLTLAVANLHVGA